MEGRQIAAISVSYSIEAYLLKNIASDCKYPAFKVHKRVRQFFFPYTIMTVGEAPLTPDHSCFIYLPACHRDASPLSVYKVMCVFPHGPLVFTFSIVFVSICVVQDLSGQ